MPYPSRFSGSPTVSTSVRVPTRLLEALDSLGIDLVDAALCTAVMYAKPMKQPPAPLAYLRSEFAGYVTKRGKPVLHTLVEIVGRELASEASKTPTRAPESRPAPQPVHVASPKPQPSAVVAPTSARKLPPVVQRPAVSAPSRQPYTPVEAVTALVAKAGPVLDEAGLASWRASFGARFAKYVASRWVRRYGMDGVDAHQNASEPIPTKYVADCQAAINKAIAELNAKGLLLPITADTSRADIKYVLDHMGLKS